MTRRYGGNGGKRRWCKTSVWGLLTPAITRIVANPDYAGYPGSDAFEPWQDHEWPQDGDVWDSTIHHFRCTTCGWDLLLWDAN